MLSLWLTDWSFEFAVERYTAVAVMPFCFSHCVYLLKLLFHWITNRPSANAALCYPPGFFSHCKNRRNSWMSAIMICKSNTSIKQNEFVLLQYLVSLFHKNTSFFHSDYILCLFLKVILSLASLELSHLVSPVLLTIHFPLHSGLGTLIDSLLPWKRGLYVFPNVGNHLQRYTAS